MKFRPFFEVRINFKLLEFRHVVYHFEARDPKNQNIYFALQNI